jgi:hypothetical protein
MTEVINSKKIDLGATERYAIQSRGFLPRADSIPLGGGKKPDPDSEYPKKLVRVMVMTLIPQLAPVLFIMTDISENMTGRIEKTGFSSSLQPNIRARLRGILLSVVRLLRATYFTRHDK